MAISNLITNKTKIIELQDNKYNYKFISKKTGIDKQLCECWDDWYFYNNKWYYFKDFSCAKYTNSEFKLINELIGEYLANYLNIDTIHYVFARKKDVYGLASENFNKQDNKYYLSIDIDIPTNYSNMNNLLLVRSKCKNESNYQELLTELYKFLAIDIYMNQTDRSYCNYQFRKYKGNLHLAPLYDYEESFMEPTKKRYDSNLVGLDICDINKYQELLSFISKLYELNIKKVIEEIEDIRGINISKEDKEYYQEFTNERKALIKSFI